ncbi:MAG: glutamate--tRNA ligase [Clostridiales bacterium]|nr:glutamate--tRNA ligase [Clostridiales bacterium]
MNDKAIRTRFAPSPTGYMHIGNLRTALYCYLFAKHCNGKFILRIEDTDQKRYVEGATDVIYSTLKKSKLFHDEGPDIGGNYGPYVQTERMEIYKKYALELVEKGFAYYCFCDKSSHEEKEGEASIGYDRHCRNLSAEEIENNLKLNKPYVIRQKVPLDGTTSFYDEVYGEITVENSTLDDQVLLKSDGLPTYNFANVIDDHLMNITHILRGKEYISSTPKYQLLYNAFGWEPPKTAHLSTIMGKNADGSVSKLSKRHGSVSFEQLIKDGYLVEAVINYITLLGWSPRQEREIFSLEELIEIFDLEGLVKTNAIFSYEKLAWMNGEYIKKLAPSEFEKISYDYATNLPSFIKDKWTYVAKLLQNRINVFTEVEDKLKFLYNYGEFDLELLINKKNKTTIESSIQVLKDSIDYLGSINDWTDSNINEAITQYSNQLNLKLGFVMWPLRIAVTGEVVTPGGCGEMMYILGKEETLSRLQQTLNRIENK